MEQSILISLLTSATTTTILLFVFKTIFKSKIDHYFNTQIEKLKSELSITTDVEQKISTRRLEAYSSLVEIIYRTRNMARDLSTHFTQTNLSLSSEFKSRVKELENCLYKYRIDLERDELFVGVHEYKNILLNYSMKLSDIKYFMEHNEEERILNNKKELLKQFELIEEKYNPIVHELSVYKGNEEK